MKKRGRPPFRTEEEKKGCQKKNSQKSNERMQVVLRGLPERILVGM